MSVLIDTSVFVDAERSGGIARAFFSGASPFGADVSLAISVVTLTEMAYGYERNSRYSQQQKDNLMSALRASYNVYPVTADIAVRAGRLNSALRQNGTAIGIADVLIAATALEFNFSVLTHNVRHFSYVPGLQVLNASTL